MNKRDIRREVLRVEQALVKGVFQKALQTLSPPRRLPVSWEAKEEKEKRIRGVRLTTIVTTTLLWREGAIVTERKEGLDTSCPTRRGRGDMSEKKKAWARYMRSILTRMTPGMPDRDGEVGAE